MKDVTFHYVEYVPRAFVQMFEQHQAFAEPLATGVHARG